MTHECLHVHADRMRLRTLHARSIYERAVAYCGSDYIAHTLWDKYLAFEEEVSTPSAVAALYTRILNLPLRELPRYLSRCGGSLLPMDYA